LIPSADLDDLLAGERLPQTYLTFVETVHAPLAEHIAAAARACDSTFTVGVCGSQGSGKSTMALVLRRLLETQGLHTVAVSIDDLYLTRAARLELSRQIHPLLKTRGVPGTHDVALGLQMLGELRHPGTVALPSFDKSQDDRRPPEQWPRMQGPAQVVILEGWCVGAVPQDAAALAAPVNALERDLDGDGTWRRYVNTALAGDYQRLFAQLDRLVLLQAPDFDVVHGWRLEQEHKLRARLAAEGRDPALSMSDAEIERFIQHYERLTRHILAEMPARADVVVRLDAQRRPTAVTNRSDS
jgi:D-glycerate 3-kinase